MNRILKVRNLATTWPLCGNQDLLTPYTVGAIAQELHEFSDNMLSGFPSDVFSEAAAISSALRSLTDRFETSKESVPKLTDRVREDIDLLSAVLTDMSGSVTEIVEQTTYTRNFGQPSHKAIWDD